MGLFRHKKTDEDTQVADEQVSTALEKHFLDENVREEMRNHGRLYFEKVVDENGALFKEELDKTVQSINTELKGHIIEQLDKSIEQMATDLKAHMTEQVDERLAAYKEKQDTVLKQLDDKVTEQDKKLTELFEENGARINAIRDVQDSALRWLKSSAEQLEAQHDQMNEMLEKDIENRKSVIISSFQQNMAEVIEHYLLEAVADQYDLKEQMSGIMDQLEKNKQTIADDMQA